MNEPEPSRASAKRSREGGWVVSLIAEQNYQALVHVLQDFQFVIREFAEFQQSSAGKNIVSDALPVISHSRSLPWTLTE
jgi:hypothetical protein